MRYTLSSPGIVVVENGRSCWRDVGHGLVSGARRPLSTIIEVTIRWNCSAIHHHTLKMLPPNLLWGWWLVRFWPAMERIPIVLHPHCKRQVWVAPRNCPKLTIPDWEGHFSQLLIHKTHSLISFFKTKKLLKEGEENRVGEKTGHETSPCKQNIIRSVRLDNIEHEMGHQTKDHVEGLTHNNTKSVLPKLQIWKCQNNRPYHWEPKHLSDRKRAEKKRAKSNKALCIIQSLHKTQE